MKRLIALLLAAALSLSLVACGGGNDDNIATQSNSNRIEDSEPTLSDEPVKFALSETVSTDRVKFTLERFEFADCLYIGEVIPNVKVVPDIDRTMLPLTDEERSELQSRNYIKASSGTIYATMSFSIENISKTSTKVPYGYIELEYDGYLFKQSDDETIISLFLDCTDMIENGYDSSIVYQIDLGVLEPAHEYRGYIAVPREVLEYSDKPLNINIYLPCESGEDEMFTYSIR